MVKFKEDITVANDILFEKSCLLSLKFEADCRRVSFFLKLCLLTVFDKILVFY